MFLLKKKTISKVSDLCGKCYPSFYALYMLKETDGAEKAHSKIMHQSTISILSRINSTL